MFNTNHVALLACCMIIGFLSQCALADYGSYVVICDSSSQNVTFVNFPKYGCQGTPTLFSEPLNQCHPELVVFSWNGYCNSTTMWYQNFENTKCTGTSALSRVYETFSCQNCTNVECKNGGLASVELLQRQLKQN